MNKPEKNNKFPYFRIIESIFFVAISVCTIWNLFLTKEQAALYEKQTKLIFSPVVGVVDIKTIRVRGENKDDTYENIENLVIQFIIENTGNLPAKNLKIETIGKLGNTILPHTLRSENDKGIVLVPKTKVYNPATISKQTIDRFVKNGEKLTYNVNLSHSDLEDYTKYEYSNQYEMKVISKEPFMVVLEMQSVR